MEFKKRQKKNSIAQTIRFSEEVYNKISKLAEENDISFNAIVNQIVEYVLENIK